MDEPLLHSLALTTLGLLLGLCVIFARYAGRAGVPLALAFLLIGMAAGSDGLGGIYFEDYPLAYHLGTTALVVILFDGGINTRLRSVKEVLLPASLLATLGVLLTAGGLALAARLVGLPWEVGCLLGAVVSSTDAAAVFALLRGAGLRLRRRVAATIEAESGLNDPMAVLLTVAVTGYLSGEATGIGGAALGILVQLGGGALGGILLGRAGRWLLDRLTVPAAGLVPALAIALAMVAYGLPSLLGGSGFLAVYVAGMILGDGNLPHRAVILRVLDAGAWFCQVSMFLMLGLLVFPSRLGEAALPGLALALLLAFVVRPLAVHLCLLPFAYTAREKVFVSWVGLRGAVPIVLAILPVLAGVPEGETVFDLVFFVVVVGSLVPGAVVAAAARRLGMQSPEPAPAKAVLEFSSLGRIRGDIVSFTVAAPSAVCGAALRDIPFPEGSAVMLIVRGEELVVPKGKTELREGDHVHVFLRPEDAPLLHLLFGRPEEG